MGVRTDIGTRRKGNRVMKPRIPITSQAFKYTNSASTDVAATFRRIRREQAEAAKQEQAVVAESAAKVRVLRSRGLT